MQALPELGKLLVEVEVEAELVLNLDALLCDQLFQVCFEANCLQFPLELLNPISKGQGELDRRSVLIKWTYWI